MASIQIAGGHGSKRPLDSELPLVPFIDLLLCCVMFLLVTAVWNQLSAIEVRPPSSGLGPTAPLTASPLTLSLSTERWLLITPESARFEMPVGDVAALHDALLGRRPNEDELAIAPDDGVPYETVVAAIDVAIGAGITDVSMAGDGPL